MNEFVNKNRLKLFVLALSLVMIITSFSYAWFTGVVNGNNLAQATVIESGKMEVTFLNGQVIGTVSNMIPGQSIVKSFTVTNTGTVTASYNIYLNDVVNTFVDRHDLVYTLSSSDGGATTNQTVCPVDDGAIASNISIGTNTTHHYTLTISFLETNDDQDDNKGKLFRSKIELLEDKTAPVSTASELATAFSTGGEYKLSSDIDISSSSTINIDEDTIIDFNGKTITSGVNQIVVGNNATLTLNSINGGGITTTDGCVKVDGGKLIVNGGKFTSTNGSALRITSGELDFNGGEVLASANAINTVAFNNTVINGGHLKSTSSTGSYAVYFTSGGNVEINDGWIDGLRGGIWIGNGTTGTINGGYITSHDGFENNERINKNFYSIYMYDASLTINGGHFYSETRYNNNTGEYDPAINIYNDGANLTINHGYFSSNERLSTYGLTQVTPINDSEHNAIYNYQK